MQLRGKIKVGLVQISDKFGNQYYLPYSIGLLQAYAHKNLKTPEEFVFISPIYKRIKVDKAVDCLLGADVVFFSTYIWNYKLSLEIAKGVKQTNANCVIVFGGPQVPEARDGIKTFLRNYPFIDIACYGEGEVAFLKVLENVKEKSWGNVPSIAFISKDNYFTYNPISKKIQNLNEIPSPYLEGIFDSLIETNPQENWSALIETNRGCPYSCAFCYWGKETRAGIRQYDIERVSKEIDWISQQKIEFVFCCDANFGLLKRDVNIVTKVAENKKRYGYPDVFSVQNAKNSTKKIFVLQKILNDSGLQKGVNLAIQSLNKNTLKSIDRDNISNETYSDLQRMFAQERIPTFSDMIIGLPNESYDTFTKGVSRLIEGGQHNRIQFINLVSLENTKMSEPQYQKKHGLITKKTKNISHHTSLDNKPEVYETQELVVGTKTMPKEDWVKTRVFAWMISLLYFNKLLQIPFALINKIYAVNYRELTEVFMNDSVDYSEILNIRKFFSKKAEDIQNGDCEYLASKEWLNIWWPADELMLIKLCAENKLETFYEEAKQSIKHFLRKKGFDFTPCLLDESIYLNQSLMKLPFRYTDQRIQLSYNLVEVYQAALRGVSMPIENGIYNYHIDRKSKTWSSWEDWCRKVIWYESKKGAYLYNCKPLTK